MDDLDRLFRRLVENIRAEYPAYLSSPFPVAELYQSVIPYRDNRTEIEIEMHEDYELALTRLLAGERGYVVGDATMQLTLATALASPPSGNAALTYRTYAAALVEIAPEAVRAIDLQAVRTPPGRPTTPTVSPAVRPPAMAPTAIIAHGPCLFCGGALPDGQRITFCPHCGQNVTVKLCPACSAELEVDWKFCPTCGRGIESESTIEVQAG